MRQITEKSVKNFLNEDNFNKNNTQVLKNEDTTGFYLHGNLIALNRKGKIIITNAGWFSNTTKERLNGILQNLGFDKIYQKNFEWFLAGQKWNGKPARLLKHNRWEYV